MAKHSLEIDINDRYYDEHNGRYITVESINRDSSVALCKVEEFDDYLKPVTSLQLFHAIELSHFQKKEV